MGTSFFARFIVRKLIWQSYVASIATAPFFPTWDGTVPIAARFFLP